MADTTATNYVHSPQHVQSMNAAGFVGETSACVAECQPVLDMHTCGGASCSTKNPLAPRQ